MTERKEAVRAEWSKADQDWHDQIVHRLRSQGWQRWEAIEEADLITGRARPAPTGEGHD